MMKRGHIALVFLFVLALVLRLYRFAHFHVLPESDVYYYINIFNNIINGGSFLQGLHPGFNMFMGLLGRITGIDFFTLFVYVGPFLGATLVFAMYLLGKRLYDERIGLLSAFFIAVTPLAIIRDGQTIAETLAFPLLVMYILLMYDTSREPSKRSLLMIPTFILIFFIHNLTGAVTIFVTLVGFFFYMLFKKEYKKSALIAALFFAFISIIYFTPSDKLPAFQESYDLLYNSVKQYFSTFSFGADTSLSWNKFDLLFPMILLAIPGLIISAYRHEKNDIFLIVVFASLFSLTQLFRVDFNFLPHRFLIYLTIPLSIAAARFTLLIYDNFDLKSVKYSRYAVLIPLILIASNSLSFGYNFNFLISEEDFDSLIWARGELDGNIVAYSKINNTQNKYTAISDNDIEFMNTFFNTGSVDYDMMDIVSCSFDIPLGQTPPEGSKVYYTSLTKDHEGYIKLNRSDRCLTSINIINTFWEDPEYVAICDAREYGEAVSFAKEHKLPLILYSNERYDEVIEALESWDCRVVLIDEIDVLVTAFDYKGIEYSFSYSGERSYEPIENTYLYYDKYDASILESVVKEYLYVSKEAQEDFPDLEENCDQTLLLKLYDTETTGYYLNI
ncbi:MAG TPA: hypothetical protein PLC12_03930 [Candidatus Methanofastidiosa archaeon]|nr:hypothetical protein [Candidatus Methanofastidiosa archaeon]